MAEQGFVTMSIDLPFWGESEGRPRNLVSPDLFAEAFSAAVDYLGNQPFVDRERIGVLSICGSGSFAVSAAKIDPRMKVVATVSMYDVGAVNRHALNKSQTVAQRKGPSSPTRRSGATSSWRHRSDRTLLYETDTEVGSWG